MSVRRNAWVVKYHQPNSFANAAIIPCSLSISPLDIGAVNLVGNGLESEVRDSRMSLRTEFHFSEAFPTGCRGNNVKSVKGVGRCSLLSGC